MEFGQGRREKIQLSKMANKKRTLKKQGGEDLKSARLQSLKLKIEPFEDSFSPFKGEYIDIRVLLLDEDGQLQVR